MKPAEHHDDFLRRLATGDEDPASDVARRHLAECPGCRERWFETARLQETLESADSERREVLEDLGEPTEADVELARRALAASRVLPAPRSERRAPRKLVLLGLLAAAALIVAVVALRESTRDRSPHDPGPLLGGGDARIVDDDGVLDAAGVEFDYPAGPGRSLRIEIEGWSKSGERVVESTRVWARSYRPDSALLERLTGTVILRVQPLDASGQPDGPPFERAFSLSR